MPSQSRVPLRALLPVLLHWSLPLPPRPPSHLLLSLRLLLVVLAHPLRVPPLYVPARGTPLTVGSENVWVLWICVMVVRWVLSLVPGLLVRVLRRGCLI